MSDFTNRQSQQSLQADLLSTRALDHVASALCQKALSDAKSQLHPLLQSVELDRLGQRRKFLHAFKYALERQIAWKLSTWCPKLQAIFSYESTPHKNTEGWDGSIHLLVKVPEVSADVDVLSKMIDSSLIKCLKRLNWQHFKEYQSILTVQQVTPNELRRGIGYGAMFYAVYTAPVKVWPLDNHKE